MSPLANWYWGFFPGLNWDEVAPLWATRLVAINGEGVFWSDSDTLLILDDETSLDVKDGRHIQAQVGWGHPNQVLSKAAIARMLNGKSGPSLPEPGSRWRHRNGTRYTVLHIVNDEARGMDKNRGDFPVTVVYQGDDGRKWCRPVADWTGRFTRLESPNAGLNQALEEYSRSGTETVLESINARDRVLTALAGEAARAFPCEGYELLHGVFRDAHDQAAYGKGDERHANDLPFHEQRMQTISRDFDSPFGMAFQVEKKLQEGLQMKDHGACRRELLGALNYLAGIVIFLDAKAAPAGGDQ